jgi:hypothetical protein
MQAQLMLQACASPLAAAELSCVVLMQIAHMLIYLRCGNVGYIPMALFFGPWCMWAVRHAGHLREIKEHIEHVGLQTCSSGAFAGGVILIFAMSTEWTTAHPTCFTPQYAF